MSKKIIYLDKNRPTNIASLTFNSNVKVFSEKEKIVPHSVGDHPVTLNIGFLFNNRGYPIVPFYFDNTIESIGNVISDNLVEHLGILYSSLYTGSTINVYILTYNFQLSASDFDLGIAGVNIFIPHNITDFNSYYNTVTGQDAPSSLYYSLTNDVTENFLSLKTVESSTMSNGGLYIKLLKDMDWPYSPENFITLQDNAVFDGNNKKIKGDFTYGIFSVIGDFTLIKNVKVYMNISSESLECGGGIVQPNQTKAITLINVVHKGVVNSCCGGLVGTNVKGTITIIDSKHEGNISAYGGGLCGMLSGSGINYIKTHLTIVSGSGTNGYNITITNCKSKGSVEYCGGGFLGAYTCKGGNGYQNDSDNLPKVGGGITIANSKYKGYLGIYTGGFIGLGSATGGSIADVPGTLGYSGNAGNIIILESHVKGTVSSYSGGFIAPYCASGMNFIRYSDFLKENITSDNNILGQAGTISIQKSYGDLVVFDRSAGLCGQWCATSGNNGYVASSISISNVYLKGKFYDNSCGVYYDLNDIDNIIDVPDTFTPSILAPLINVTNYYILDLGENAFPISSVINTTTNVYFGGSLRLIYRSLDNLPNNIWKKTKTYPQLI